MNTTHTTSTTALPIGTVEHVGQPRRRIVGGAIVGAAALIAVAGVIAAVSKLDDTEQRPDRPVMSRSGLTEREQLQYLVDSGAIPREALDPVRRHGMSEREELEYLVDLGAIPRQALDPAPVA